MFDVFTRNKHRKFRSDNHGPLRACSRGDLVRGMFSKFEALSATIAPRFILQFRTRGTSGIGALGAWIE